MSKSKGTSVKKTAQTKKNDHISKELQPLKWAFESGNFASLKDQTQAFNYKNDAVLAQMDVWVKKAQIDKRVYAIGGFTMLFLFVIALIVLN